MKKLMLLAVLAFVVSCSSSDGNGDENNFAYGTYRGTATYPNNETIPFSLTFSKNGYYSYGVRVNDNRSVQGVINSYGKYTYINEGTDTYYIDLNNKADIIILPGNTAENTESLGQVFPVRYKLEINRKEGRSADSKLRNLDTEQGYTLIKYPVWTDW